MTPPHRPDDVTDLDGFERLLSRLVSSAEAVGLDVEGAYDVRTPQSDRSDYTVEITVIRKRIPGPDATDEIDE